MIYIVLLYFQIQNILDTFVTMTITPNLIKIPVVEDVRGNLGFIQNDILPFEFKRIYYLFDVSSNAFRAGHSHIY